MAMVSMFFFTLLALGTSQILPMRCNVASSQCVGEGSYCDVDWNNDCVSPIGNSWSACRKCSDNTLICRSGVCMKKTQGRGETCNSAQHLWCQPPYTCNGGSSGTCVDYTQSTPYNFASRGEACQTNSDCGGSYLSCDPFLNVCVNNNVDPSSLENYCSSWSDCRFGEYCSPADSTTNNGISATCKKNPTGLGSRTNSLCKKSGSVTGQCGWTQPCADGNSDETNAGNTPYTTSTCQALYSQPEGAMCAPDFSMSTLGFPGSSNNYLFSFCASGPCVQLNVGGVTENRCSSADYTYAGTGCRTNDECGRGLSCQCPAWGGGRARCTVGTSSFPGSTTIYAPGVSCIDAYCSWNMGHQIWNQYWQPWLSCLESNQCTLNSDTLGSCGQKHCAHLYPWDVSNQPTGCKTGRYGNFYDVPDYKGYSSTINGVNVVCPSFVSFTLIFIVTISMLIKLFKKKKNEKRRKAKKGIR